MLLVRAAFRKFRRLDGGREILNKMINRRSAPISGLVLASIRRYRGRRQCAVVQDREQPAGCLPPPSKRRSYPRLPPSLPLSPPKPEPPYRDPTLFRQNVLEICAAQALIRFPVPAAIAAGDFVGRVRLARRCVFAAHKLGDSGIEMMEIDLVEGKVKRRVINTKPSSATSSSRASGSRTRPIPFSSRMIPRRHQG